MRGGLFNLSTIARAAGFALVGVGILAAVIHVGRYEAAPLPVRTAVAPQTDPLTHEIARCEALGTAAEQDAWCEAAWAENRRRFFTYQPADSASRNLQARNPAASKAEGR